MLWEPLNHATSTSTHIALQVHTLRVSSRHAAGTPETVASILHGCPQNTLQVSHNLFWLPKCEIKNAKMHANEQKNCHFSTLPEGHCLCSLRVPLSPDRRRGRGVSSCLVRSESTDLLVAVSHNCSCICHSSAFRFVFCWIINFGSIELHLCRGS